MTTHKLHTLLYSDVEPHNMQSVCDKAPECGSPKVHEQCPTMAARHGHRDGETRGKRLMAHVIENGIHAW